MIEVEIWSDFACPFCYIGKRQFEMALEQFPKKDQVQVTFRSFELDPEAAKSQKISIYEVLAKKYGRDIEWAKKANQNVIQMGAQCGIQFEIEKIIPTNSFDAHRLNHLATENGLQDQMQEALFQTYFTDGKDIAQPEVLKAIGIKVGLKEDQINKMLGSDEYTTEVRQDQEEAQEMGISGVPLFLFNRRFAVSGAQPAEVFVKALEQASSSN